MSAARKDPREVISHIEVDENGNVVVMLDGKISIFDVDSTRMRKFAQELIEAAVRKDMRT